MDTKYMVRETLKSGCGVGLHIRLSPDQEHGSLAASALHAAHPELHVQVQLSIITAGSCTVPSVLADSAQPLV